MHKTIVLITKYTADISKKFLSQNFSIFQMSKKLFIAYFIGKYEDIFQNNCGIWLIDMNTPQNIYKTNITTSPRVIKICGFLNT